MLENLYTVTGKVHPSRPIHRFQALLGARDDLHDGVIALLHDARLHYHGPATPTYR
jgi:hypothetical protein